MDFETPFFIDWLTCYQEFSEPLPLIGEVADQRIDLKTGEGKGYRIPSFTHEGSFSTSIQIRITGNRLTVSGNPSRFGRSENLFGYTSIDDCVGVYNQILLQLGLPPFTKCTQIWQSQRENGGSISDGCIIRELHVTTNKCVGAGNEDDYLKGLATQNFRYMIPRLHTDGKTVDWLSKNGKRASLLYPSVYNKAHEMRIHTLAKLKKKLGEDSPDFHYAQRVADYCESHGVVRFEIKLNHRALQRMACRYWGLFHESAFNKLIQEFTSIDQKLKVTAMTYESINQQLLQEGICKSTVSANATANYAFRWMHGERFDTSKRAVQTARARLRKIGIDIAHACDISRFSPVRVKEVREVTVSDLPMPDFYRQPQRLRLVA